MVYISIEPAQGFAYWTQSYSSPHSIFCLVLIEIHMLEKNSNRHIGKLGWNLCLVSNLCQLLRTVPFSLYLPPSRVRESRDRKGKVG